jgi:cytoskeletal protein RodZ
MMLRMRSKFWQKFREDPAHSLTIISILVNVALLGFTGALAYYSFGQWRAVDETLREIHAQTPAVLKSADAAASSAATAKAAQDSSDSSSRTTLEEMRRQTKAEASLAAATKTVADTSIQQFALSAEATKATLAEMEKQSAEMASQREAMSRQADATADIAVATYTAADTAAKQLDANERPLLSVDKIELSTFGVTDSEGTAALLLAISVTNKGRNPATETSLTVDTKIGLSSYLAESNKQLYETCHKEDANGRNGTLVAPGDRASISNMSIMSPPSITTAMQERNAKILAPRGLISGVVYACVTYKDGAKLHHTGLIYDLSVFLSPAQVAMIEKRQLPFRTILVIDKNVNLRLRAFMNGFMD